MPKIELATEINPDKKVVFDLSRSIKNAASIYWKTNSICH
ncbi:hypothetical protein SAMN05443667_10764 [Flavobacterium gillisiae]|uniref:Uncharacterized protein n=1 Tax=Flavobacterium gillisiae TaxID=150146 RepID=A0A1H4D578_9FLAO|nr:hypothetical protein SAMN05443667_10764 [Flavobacterium gillisiae]